MTIVVRVFLRVRNAHIHYISTLPHGGVVVTVVAWHVKRPKFDPDTSTKQLLFTY